MTDRDLDRRVAEKVMGWTVSYPYRPEQPWITGSDGIARNLDFLNDRREEVVPYFTSRPAAWMQVVERMRERKYTWAIRNAGGGWAVTVFDNRRMVSYGDSAQLGRAICLAALKAVEAR